MELQVRLTSCVKLQLQQKQSGLFHCSGSNTLELLQRRSSGVQPSRQDTADGAAAVGSARFIQNVLRLQEHVVRLNVLHQLQEDRRVRTALQVKTHLDRFCTVCGGLLAGLCRLLLGKRCKCSSGQMFSLLQRRDAGEADSIAPEELRGGTPVSPE